ncbi:hypothetical protein [Rhizobium sp. NPDC090279]|uniref:hypothetical protein n=1 Tax=Rhizobium sp. NPDC090279 TaxID=3364499 RepID=UPI00383ABABE
MIILPIGTAYNIIKIRPPFDLFLKWMSLEYYFDQSALQVILEPTLRAISFAAVFTIFATFHAIPQSRPKENGSLFSSRRWSAMYLLLAVWELFLGSLNILLIFQSSTAMWLLVWNSGIVVLLNCLFLAALTFGFINSSRVDEEDQKSEMPSVPPKREWRHEEAPSAEGAARKITEFSPIDMEIRIPGGFVVATKTDKPDRDRIK